MGGAVAAGMGGGGGRARSNVADDPSSSDVARVKDLDKFGQAREAERLAVEAMARVGFFFKASFGWYCSVVRTHWGYD